MYIRKQLYALLIAILIGTVPFASRVHAQSFTKSNELPDMGSSINKVLPLNVEQELGEKYMRYLRLQLDIVSDPLIRTYINELGFKLVANNEDAKDRQFYFFVINEPSINAFAMPGGYIGVNTGLIIKASSEDELAGVIAHEIAHVTQRHIARRIEQQQSLSMPMMLATLGSILVMTQSTEAGMAALTGVQAGATQMMINHTRSNESEADRIGILTLAKAGFNPAGMANFFEKLLEFTRYSNKQLAFLSTHPLSQQRVTEARDRARNLKYQPNKNEFSFKLFKRRLSSLIPSDPKKEKRRYEKMMKNFKSSNVPTAIQFGYALTLGRLEEYDEAIARLNSLIIKYPSNLDFILALADQYTLAQQPKMALKLLDKPLKLNHGNDAITMAYAEALIADHQEQEALSILYEHLPKVENEPSIYETIADAQSQLGKYKEVHESTGLFLYYSGDLHGAISQFKLALKGRSEDPYFNSRLYARVRMVQEEILETK